jgi:hypothetical protein
MQRSPEYALGMLAPEKAPYCRNDMLKAETVVGLGRLAHKRLNLV